MVTLPVAFDQCGARRGERLCEASGGDLGTHCLHAQRLALIGRRGQRGDACRHVAREPRMIGRQRLSFAIEGSAAFAAKREFLSQRAFLRLETRLPAALASQPLFQPGEAPPLFRRRALYIGGRRHEGRELSGRLVTYARRLLSGCFEPSTLAIELFQAGRHALAFGVQFLPAPLGLFLLATQLREPAR